MNNDNKKKIPSEAIDRLADKAICRMAEEEDIELGHALKNITESQLRGIVGKSQPTRHAFNIRKAERFAWTLAVAALLVVALIAPLRMENNSDQKIDRLLYSYNVTSLPGGGGGVGSDRGGAGDPRGGEDEAIDLTVISDEQLKEKLPRMKEAYLIAETPQEIAIEGKRLVLSYIRLHERGEARETLQSMIDRLSENPEAKKDYAETIRWCVKIQSELE